METKSARNILPEDMPEEQLKKITISMLQSILKRKAECHCPNCSDSTRDFFGDYVFLLDTTKQLKSHVTQRVMVSLCTLLAINPKMFIEFSEVLFEIIEKMEGGPHGDSN